ncbi:MFS transporter [Clostridium estertheticum]|uniref:MFS transporter n=1 Tax=Clostridium estertheticum TaxID=238834 RepID=UPI001CF1D58E|nr:MFS transporter [Clostridium estertheticum]MCB2309216.1 MFS transporter [Clostridium estertheticum]MCB2347580.1 MFS transporter [Clostridium estertheticum]MCB2352172.1 MFS transporter [Clostridium estertheticum]WAG48357.1 MFS transporter [Clostridium estertheticum]
MKDNTKNKFPLSALLALAMVGFLAIMTETIPAGLLPHISEGLNVSESLAGQLVTLYAIGSLVAAIPVIALTRQWRRRPLLLSAIIGFLIFNSITAISPYYFLTLVARFFAGVSAGVAWGLIAGYARRMVSDEFKGRGMAIAMIGTPIALAFGVPIGTFLGSIIGWRLVFVIMSLLAIILIGWILIKVPDFPGQDSKNQVSILKVFITPGVRPILAVVLCWMTAHNILYTYIYPFLISKGVGRVDFSLFIFGILALISIVIIGLLIDSHLRVLVLISILAFAIDSILFGISGGYPIALNLEVALWGLTFGGAATLLQTALAESIEDEAVDVVMSINTTVWNLAIACGSVVGGIILKKADASLFPWSIFVLLIIALSISWKSKKYGFVQK